MPNKAKVSITLDPSKLSHAQELLGTMTVSHLVDLALDRLIGDELDRRHIEGYVRYPVDESEDAWAEARRPGDIADDTDWASLYAVEPE
ncbi:MAG: hypothetical protein DLM65_14080 [Candidatus Aeolococcus gillhamiae]|uniref:Antitoxin n=1 Tax=Candidatus Aeolococcus gillhamiae TaxID=3127015 RepID=A0A2W5ZXK4_9BACT|nr:MAG: hypothetical protein DLM65_14080 [Candidatus Dormibacter sp. RRmetagenome_bin12]